jgi:hypothetical protein
VLPQLDVNFLPQAAAFENVAAQIKTGTAAYSVIALARLFLQKPDSAITSGKKKNASPAFSFGRIERHRRRIETVSKTPPFACYRDNFTPPPLV